MEVSSALPGAAPPLFARDWHIADQACSGARGKTFCHPGASVNDIKSCALHLSDQFRTVSTLVLEAGVNDIKHQQSEVLKDYFIRFIEASFQCPAADNFRSTTLSCFGDLKFSRLRQLHTWLKGYCMHNSIPFVDNFAAFLDRPRFFKRDGLHPYLEGSRLLAANIELILHSCTA